MTLSEGQKVKLKIDRISNSGNPVAKYGAQHVLVQDTQPGDVVLTEIRGNGTSLYGLPLEVIESGPDTKMPEHQQQAIDVHRQKKRWEMAQRIRQTEEYLDDGQSEASEELHDSVSELDIDLTLEDSQKEKPPFEGDNDVESRNLNKELNDRLS